MGQQGNNIVGRLFLGIAVFCAVLAIGVIVIGELMPPAHTDNDSKQPNTQTFSVGDRVKLGDFYVVVKKAYISAGANEWNMPDQGKKWVVVDVEIENASNKSQIISSLMMFHLYDSQNYKCDFAINMSAKGSLDGELGAGRKMAGEITFSVPAAQSNFDFVFSPNVFTSGQAIYKLRNLK